MKFDPKSLSARDDRVRDAHSHYQQGRISRREFMRFSAMIGGAALALQLLPPQERARVLAASYQAQVKRGGTIYNTHAISTKRFDDPAKMDSVFVSNYVRQVCDYMVVTDQDMVLKPSLATEWAPSKDGLTWTVKLRQGVKFNHGKTFGADDVVFTFTRLMNKETASPFAGAVPYLKGVEKVDDSTVNFVTDRVAADFIYSLFLYHAAVLPADWPGDFFKNPWGTGPFTIDKFVPDERITFKARKDYWQQGADGKPLPYLDSVEFVSYKDDLARLNALKEGTLDISGAQPTLRDQYKAIDTLNYVLVQTGNLHIAVMHFNEKPWTDSKVREAFKLCFDRKAYVDTIWAGEAIQANDHPIAPGIYPLAPADQTPRKQDYEKAKALLKEAGYPDGFDLKVFYIDKQSDGGFAEKFAVFMESQVKPAGIRMTLQPDPAYWDKWLKDWGEFTLGASNWAQKTSASEMFNLAYRSDGIWNETHWKNPEFDALLKQFDQELDAEKRKQQLAQLTDILSKDGPIMIPGFYQQAVALSKKVHYRPHPANFVWMGNVWTE
ncbi:MAG: twin-arginine translocation signal domain-containing protein [Anaerolineae bacterium]|nr:twin-arginine translocation signal domain-containing protein [Anaerolineae bacterium]